MGKERDNLIRRYNGVPLSERDHATDEDLAKERMADYVQKGRLPPEIEALHRKKTKDDQKQ